MTMTNLGLVSAQHVQFSTQVLVLGHHGTGMQIYQPIFIVLKTKYPDTQFTIWIVYWSIFISNVFTVAF